MVPTKKKKDKSQQIEPNNSILINYINNNSLKLKWSVVLLRHAQGVGIARLSEYARDVGTSEQEAHNVPRAPTIYN